MEVMPDYLVELQREFKYKTVAVPGPLHRFDSGRSDPDLGREEFEHVLNKNFANYEKGKNVRDILGDFLGNGILLRTVNSGNFIVRSQVVCFPGHFFVRVRCSYHKKRLEHYPTPTPTGTQTALKNCKEVIRFIDNKIEKNESFDLAKVFFSFTMDTFVEIAFGTNLVHFGNLIRLQLPLMSCRVFQRRECEIRCGNCCATYQVQRKLSFDRM